MNGFAGSVWEVRMLLPRYNAAAVLMNGYAMWQFFA